MARKSKILRNFKEVKKTAIPVAVNSAITGVSFLGAKAATNKLTPKITNTIIKKVVGPAKILLGIVMEAFIDEPHIAAIGRGLAVSGFDSSADDFIPDTIKTKIGLSGVGEINANADNAFDWEAAAHEVVNESSVNGDENPDDADNSSVGNTDEDLASKAINS